MDRGEHGAYQVRACAGNLELANAYATFASGGQFGELRLVTFAC